MKYNVVAVLAFVLSACASNTNVLTPVTVPDADAPSYADVDVVNAGTEAPSHFLEAIRSYLDQAMHEQGLIEADAARQVRVVVTDYRMRSGFTRAMFGVLAGKDGVDSQVTIIDRESGEIVGQSDITSYNVMAIGGMEDIARMHAKEIAMFLGGDR
jgi:hypothetical protein